VATANTIATRSYLFGQLAEDWRVGQISRDVSPGRG